MNDTRQSRIGKTPPAIADREKMHESILHNKLRLGIAYETVDHLRELFLSALAVFRRRR